MSAAFAAAAASAACYSSRNNSRTQNNPPPAPPSPVQNYSLPTFMQPVVLSRYESQKRKDWVSFLEFLRNRTPPLTVSRCSEADVLEFLRRLDQFGDTKVHVETCPFFGRLQAPSSCNCGCPVQQACSSVEAIVGRLRAAFQESNVQCQANPFTSRAVGLYLRDMKDAQAKSRGTVC